MKKLTILLFLAAFFIFTSCSGNALTLTNYTGEWTGSYWLDDFSQVEDVWDVDVTVNGVSFGRINYGDASASKAIKGSSIEVDKFDVLEMRDDRGGSATVNISDPVVQTAIANFKATSDSIPVLAGPDLTWEIGYDENGSSPEEK